MKLIIGCLNSKFIHNSSAPWCLLAGVRKFCKTTPDCSVCECTVNGDLDGYVSRISEMNPDAVSFSTYIWNVEQTLYVCERLKTALGCKIILGGPEVAYRPKDVLARYPFVDFVLTGEGEFCFPPLVDALDACGELSDVAGLTYRTDNSLLSVAEATYTDTPPSPFTDEYFEALNGRICYIESSRGCPYRCAFCLSGRVSKLRFFDADVTKRDMLRLANSGTQTVKFVDRTFNANEAHANDILSFIKDNYGKNIPQGVCFHFEIAGDILKESTMQILSQMPTGAVQLEIGMQTFNEQTLLAINRKTDTKKLISNIKRLIGFDNMHIHIDLIAGLTGEDVKSFEQSFNIGFSLHANMLQLGFLKLLYGADMRENAEKYPCEYSDTPPYEVLSTPWMTKPQMQMVKKCEDALERMYNSGRFLLTVEFLLNQTGLTPFALLSLIGENVSGEGKSLTQYTLELYRFMKERCDGEKLRECIMTDLTCSLCSQQIPKELTVYDRRYKKVKSHFPKSAKILLFGDRILVFDRNGPRDFFGRLKNIKEYVYEA